MIKKFCKFLFFLLGYATITHGKELIRSSAASGILYPKEASDLKNWLDRHLEVSPARSVSQKKASRSLVLVVPYGPYPLCGHIDAKGFQHVAHLLFDHIVLIASDLRFSRIPSAVFWDQRFKTIQWETPLGKISIDPKARLLASRLNPLYPKMQNLFADHTTLESPLPFIQTLFPEMPVIPILVNTQEGAFQTAALLSKVFSKKSVLYIICTNLGYEFSKEDAKDKEILSLTEKGDMEGILRFVGLHPLAISAPFSFLTGLFLTQKLSLPPIQWLLYEKIEKEDQGFIGCATGHTPISQENQTSDERKIP